MPEVWNKNQRRGGVQAEQAWVVLRGRESKVEGRMKIKLLALMSSLLLVLLSLDSALGLGIKPQIRFSDDNQFIPGPLPSPPLPEYHFSLEYPEGQYPEGLLVTRGDNITLIAEAKSLEKTIHFRPRLEYYGGELPLGIDYEAPEEYVTLERTPVRIPMTIKVSADAQPGKYSLFAGGDTIEDVVGVGYGFLLVVGPPWENLQYILPENFPTPPPPLPLPIIEVTISGLEGYDVATIEERLLDFGLMQVNHLGNGHWFLDLPAGEWSIWANAEGYTVSPEVYEVQGTAGDVIEGLDFTFSRAEEIASPFNLTLLVFMALAAIFTLALTVVAWLKKRKS